MLLLHEVDVLEFLGHHEKKRGARCGYTGSSSHSVHIVLDRARQIVLNDPLNLFKIKTTRGNISTNKNWMVSFVEASKVLFSFAVIHISMQFVDMTLSHNVRWLVICLNCSICCFLIPFSEITISESVPVKVWYQLMNKVHKLAVAHKNDAFWVLMSEYKWEQIK